MAKLNKVEATEVAEAIEEKVLFVPEKDKLPSLNQLAIVLNIPAVRLQSAQVAYKPVEGLPYDPKRINWLNISAFIKRRLDKTDYATVQEVYERAFETEYTPKGRFGRTAGEGSVYGKVLFGTTPLRKGNLIVGSKIYARKGGQEFTVIFVDDTIVVYKPDGEQVVSEAIGNRMFNMNFDLTAPKADEVKTEAE